MPNLNIKDYASKGGKIRADRLTPKERSRSASIAAKARWAKYREKQSHVCEALCRCRVCGRLNYKHVKGSELCQEFQCDSIS